MYLIENKTNRTTPPKLGVAACACLAPRNGIAALTSLLPPKIIVKRAVSEKKTITFCLCITVNCPNMPIPSKPLRHTMPDDYEEAQRLVEEALGVRPCLWQIKVVRKILALDVSMSMSYILLRCMQRSDFD